jgi:hypothetical protein
LRDLTQIFPSPSGGTHNYNFTMDGTTLHDITSDNLSLYHIACMAIADSIGAVVRRVHTYNCMVFDLELGVFADGQLSNVLVENNMFGNSGNPYTNNASLALNTNTTSWNGLTVRNNSAVVAMRHPDCTNGCTNVRFSGNISPLPGWYPSACVAGVTYRNNVWTGGTNKCDASDQAVASAGFVNAAAGDLHLTVTSPAINAGDPLSYPADDIDGRARPLGGRPDAGANEAW